MLTSAVTFHVGKLAPAGVNTCPVHDATLDQTERPTVPVRKYAPAHVCALTSSQSGNQFVGRSAQKRKMAAATLTRRRHNIVVATLTNRRHNMAIATLIYRRYDIAIATSICRRCDSRLDSHMDQRPLYPR